MASFSDYDAAFGWVHWTNMRNLNTFVVNAVIGELYYEDDIASSTLAFEHVLHAATGEHLKNVFLSQVTALEGPTAKHTPRAAQKIIAKVTPL